MGRARNASVEDLIEDVKEGYGLTPANARTVVNALKRARKAEKQLAEARADAEVQNKTRNMALQQLAQAVERAKEAEGQLAEVQVAITSAYTCILGITDIYRRHDDLKDSENYTEYLKRKSVLEIMDRLQDKVK